MAFVQYDTAYLRTALTEFLANTIWDQLVTQRGVATSITDTPVRAAKVAIPITNSIEGSITPLSSSGSATGSASINQRVVEITLQEYGENPIAVNGSATLLAVTDALNEAVRLQSRAAAIALEKLVAQALVDNGVPGNNNSWTYAGKTWNPIDDNLLWLGTDTTSETSRSAVTTSDTMKSSMLRTAYAILSKRGVPKFKSSAGEFYVMVAHPYIVHDLKNEADPGGWLDVGRFIDNANGIRFGIVGIYEGFLIIESIYGTDIGIVLGDDGSGNPNVHGYRTYFFGQEYIGKGYVPQELLPITDSNVEVMPLTESVQIRVLPAYDSHARHKNVAWYAFLGYALIQPDAGLVVESASTLG